MGRRAKRSRQALEKNAGGRGFSSLSQNEERDEESDDDEVILEEEFGDVLKKLEESGGPSREGSVLWGLVGNQEGETEGREGGEDGHGEFAQDFNVFHSHQNGH